MLIHGGMNAAQDLGDLASLLSDAFTVYVPDRRGRGMSGPFGPDHTIAKEVQDVRALLDHTGSRFVFGLSAGAVVALEAAAELPQISRLAVYESPLTASADGASWNWIARYDREVAAGREHSFNRIHTKVLLMSGRRSPVELRTPVHELAGIIADSSIVELNDAGHLSATNGKRPCDVGRELRLFFS